MIEIGFIIIVAGMFFVDHRLSTLVKLTREMLVELKKANAERSTSNTEW